ncbi:MAG: HRDC domain-containing protein [Candidatus Thermoplasmatota archaeon]|nr:HRDC domain-containing protein [Candidatus Thermoplasmatota archaeon]
MSLKAIGDEELLDYVVEKDFEDTVSRIILSAVGQFPEGIGKVKLSRLLRAKDPGFVISSRPDVRDMFGRLRLLDPDQVLDFMESLVRLSLLDIEDPEFPRLVITNKGEKALCSSKLIPAMIPWPLPSKDVPIPVDEDAYDRLKAVRNRLARESALPPYCVASNLTLVEMVNRDVSTIEELITIPGIGPGRVERYGMPLLSALHGI